MECSWNDESKTKYYVVILDQLQGHSGGLVQALESRVRGPLTSSCISSVENPIETPLSSLCQLLNKEQLALFQLGV